MVLRLKHPYSTRFTLLEIEACLKTFLERLRSLSTLELLRHNASSARLATLYRSGSRPPQPRQCVDGRRRERARGTSPPPCWNNGLSRLRRRRQRSRWHRLSGGGHGEFSVFEGKNQRSFIDRNCEEMKTRGGGGAVR